jgi:predicted alpha/beta hydrolase family esterase
MLCEERALEDVGVYLFKYRADMFSGTYCIDDAVDTLREYFQLDELWSQDQLIFVCHSLGGIIARRFLISKQVNITGKRIGLFLVASPSLGSNYANFISAISPMYNSQLNSLKFSQTNT